MNMSIHSSDGNAFNGLGCGSRGRSKREPDDFSYGLGRKRIEVPVELIKV